MLNINKITIVGGGSAGWMTAAALVKFFPEKDITVIESPNTPPIGVGESTYDGIRYFCTLLEIDNKDFFAYTDASIKLGITFSNFYEKSGHPDFQYPFGFPYTKNTKWGIQDWMIKKSIYPDIPVNDFAESYFPQAHLAKHGRFSENINGEFNDFHPILDSALHFDAIKFGSWLREKYCKPKGVKHILKEVTKVNSHKNGISSLELSDKEIIFSDLYIDCTGFKSLLIGETLKEKFISYNDVLPNNRAWATQLSYKDKEKELRSVTTCTALSNGWVWDIPLWSRLGTGYVYSDKYVSSENALEEFKQHLMSDSMVVKRTRKEVDSLTYKDIQMRVGIHERVWVKNVVAVGLSAGFIEPLESNGLFTVYEFLYQLVRSMLRGPAVSQWDVDVFNHEAREIYDGFVGFIQLHYSLSIRQDSEYWIANSKRTYNFDGFDYGKEYSAHILAVKKAKTYTFVPPERGGLSWITSGLNYHILDDVSVKLGELRNRMNYKNDLEPFFRELEIKKEIWNSNALKSPTMYEYLRDTFYEK